EYPPGSKIPSYSQLASLYSVSISTAQRAVIVLRERGLVQGAQGRGVFVRERDRD
ncbi:MAG TPA: GntR family transcriptional regulator, partial [Pilimelia sp.]|nr:GntR family transcriptional regulator [Pilimelia sp.]